MITVIRCLKHLVLPVSFRVILMVIFVLLSACSDSEPNSELQSESGVEQPLDDGVQCDTASQRQWAYDKMRDTYLFADQVPTLFTDQMLNVDLLTFESTDDLVQQIRFQERDDFSSVSNISSVSSISDSQSVLDERRLFGLGYIAQYDEERKARIIDVITDSPFGWAGIERGDTILTVNGLPLQDPELESLWPEKISGSPDNPATSTWRFSKRGTGNIVELNITEAEYEFDTVNYTIYTHPSISSKIGYLRIRLFNAPTEADIDEAIEYFAQEDVSELVLDLRYNRGGLISTATHLASIIGGSELADLPLYTYRHNSRYSDSDFLFNFSADQGNLGLNRVVILTTDRTASASEIVIAGLQPYIDVVTIGSTTQGIPYLRRSYDRCNERLAVVEAEGFNAAGNSVFGGIAPTCVAIDDISRNFGTNIVNNETEGLLRSALDYITFGSCDTQATVGRSTVRPANGTIALGSYRMHLSERLTIDR